MYNTCEPNEKLTKENLWNDYSDKFNYLSDKMIEASIDTNLLIDLIKSYDAYNNILKNNYTTEITTTQQVSL
jgi:CRISPR/Cas system type I-B associated protein Csh2 (Cas7 group RAMP superfamily)